MDQRINKTYTALQNSMRTLLGTSTWNDITIQALCRHAEVSRSTFYSHFKNKEDLLDSLLLLFEQGMLNENNGRSLSITKSFGFLPVIANHVNGNRRIFAKTNSSQEGYPVAIKFKNMIQRLVAAELKAEKSHLELDKTTQSFISGGIYSALVDWSSTSEEDTHLRLLKELDRQIQILLSDKVTQAK